VVDKKVKKVTESTGGSGGGSGGGSSSSKGEPPNQTTTKPFANTAAQLNKIATLQKIAAEKQKSSSMFKTENVPFFGAQSGQKTTTINLTVNASSQVGGSAAGKAAVAELNKFKISSGGFFLTNLTR
jgi:hypothetical protein